MLEAAVIGVPDEKWGEVGLAVVVPAPGSPEDPEAHPHRAARAAGRRSRCPRHVEFVDELPKTATGKIRKPDLRNRYVPTEETTA